MKEREINKKRSLKKRRKQFGVGILMSLCILALSMVLSSPLAVAITADKPIISESHPELNEIKLTWNPIAGASGYNIYLSKDQGVSYNKIAAVPDTSFVHTLLIRDAVYYYKVVPYEKSSKGIIEGASSDPFRAESNFRGIDVSKWQGKIDWAKVKAAGINFAIIRVAGHTGRTIYEDEYFVENVTGATNAGIKVGIYFYTVATTKEEAIAEANYTLEKIKPYNITFPIAFDIESNYQKTLGKATNGELIAGFCETIKAAGYTPMVYSYLSFLNNYISYDSIKNYDLWFARINSVPAYSNPIRIWQYSSSGRVSGISGAVDLNYLFDPTANTNGLLNYAETASALRYYVNAGDTLSAIANKFHLTDAELLSLNPTITDLSQITVGTPLKVDGYKLVTPTQPTIKCTSYNKLKLSWKAISGADGYYIYQATSATGTFTRIAATTAKSYTNSKLETGKTYYYKIKAYRDEVTGIKVSGYSPQTHEKTVLSQVKNLTASTPSYTSIKLTWDNVAGADVYYIYRATSKTGSYKYIKTVTTNTYTNSKLTFNKNYYYKVKARRKTTAGNKTGAASDVLLKKPALKKAKGLKAKALTYNKIKLTWSKVSGANGYYVYRSTKKDGGYSKIATVKSTTYTNSSLKTKTTYYYKIKAYRKSGSKYITNSATAAVAKKTTLSKPTKVSLKTGTKKVTIKWAKVSGASGYVVYRATSKNGEYKGIKTTSSKTTAYTNTKLKAKKTYYYKVRAYRTVSGKRVYSSYSTVKWVKTK